MLQIDNLFVTIDGKQILNGINLQVKPGEIHAIMGPNGSGKSTLAYALIGHPSYSISQKSKIVLNGTDITKLPTDERAKKGLFLAFQHPLLIEGVSAFSLIKAVINDDIVHLHNSAEQVCRRLGLDPVFLKRSLNDGFSGGEKKKMEMLQMVMLKPAYAIIDEIDTGLDVDALKTVAHAIAELAKQGAGMVIITHYLRILKYLKPDKVHVVVEGKIVKSGSFALAKEVEKKGYKKINSNNK